MVKSEKKDDLDEVANYLQGIAQRVDNWEDLSPTIQRRIQEEARIQRSIQNAAGSGLRDPMRDEATFLRDIDAQVVSQQPMSDVTLREADDQDLFRPMTTGDAGSFTSGREIQVVADSAFRWDTAMLDRVERDVMDFYMDGEINA